MKKHKHWFQFVAINVGTLVGHAEFICLCGEQRIVEIKEAEKTEEK